MLLSVSFSFSFGVVQRLPARTRQQLAAVSPSPTLPGLPLATLWNTDLSISERTPKPAASVSRTSEACAATGTGRRGARQQVLSHVHPAPLTHGEIRGGNATGRRAREATTLI